MGHECCCETGPFLAWPKSAFFKKKKFKKNSLSKSSCASLISSILFFLFFFCAPFRSGINRLWSVWRYWPVTQAQYCVSSMMRESLWPGLLTQLSGTAHLFPEIIQGVFWSRSKLCQQAEQMVQVTEEKVVEVWIKQRIPLGMNTSYLYIYFCLCYSFSFNTHNFNILKTVSKGRQISENNLFFFFSFFYNPMAWISM